MLILDKLWYGDVTPGEWRYRPSKEYGSQFQKMEKCEDTIKAALSAEGKKVFEDYKDADTAVEMLAECDSFIAGFRTAVMIMLDVFHPTEGKADGRI